MMRWKTIAAVSALTLVAAGAAAQDVKGRYTMSPTDEGFMRLDTETGVMSLCSRKTGTWTCEALSGEQNPSADELEKLKAENRDLKDQITRLEESLGINEPDKHSAVPPPGANPENRLELPSEQEIDKAFDYLEGIFRKFRERIKKFEDEENKETPL